LSLYVFLYRRTSGGFGGSMQGLKVLLLTTTGRSTGKERITPLRYFEDGDSYIVIASNAGAEQHPAWFST
jgi:deazaflavin-dependent oxidoreductase (nitroreductase family)